MCDSCYGVLRNTLYFNDTYIYIKFSDFAVFRVTLVV